MTHTCCPHCSTVGHFPHSGGCPKECCEKCTNDTDEDLDKVVYEGWCKNENCSCHKETPAAVEKGKRYCCVAGCWALATYGDGTCDEHMDFKPPQPAKEWWEDEFDDRFTNAYASANGRDDGLVDGDREQVKSFIRKVAARIAAQSEKKGREQLLSIIEEMVDPEILDKLLEAARSSEEGKP